jgi:hypothetical protein
MKKTTLLPTTRESVRKQIHESKNANNYISRYFKPRADPQTRKIIYCEKANRLWVDEALILNTINRNKALNNMKHELSSLLKQTGYNIVDVHACRTNNNEDEGQKENGCEGINMDSGQTDIMVAEQEVEIQNEVNAGGE